MASERNRPAAAWRPRFVVAAVLLLTGAGAAVFGGAAIERTNRTEFCISCHEMKDNNFEEYHDTIHARNRTGIKVGCADCHVPRELGDTLLRKLGAANDVVQHFLGSIDTREKFEKRRPELAKRVWARMRSTDSRECRHCHDVASMDAEKQGKTARKQHQKMEGGDRTCIDCHFGIAHKEPADGLQPTDVVMGRD
jgi:cytochrome c-type protein NapC